MALLNNLLALLHACWELPLVAAPAVDWSAAAVLLGILTLWLGAACWSSSIAETRLHSPVLHFFAGLLVPGLYPFVLLFAMGVKSPERHARTEEAETWEVPPETPAAGEKPPSTPEERATETGPREEEEEEEQTYDQEDFRRIARDEEGNFVGPWKLEYDGQTILAERILDALPNVVVLQTIAKPGGRPQRLRIPYSKIESCVRA